MDIGDWLHSLDRPAAPEPPEPRPETPLFFPEPVPDRSSRFGRDPDNEFPGSRCQPKWWRQQPREASGRSEPPPPQVVGDPQGELPTRTSPKPLRLTEPLSPVREVASCCDSEHHGHDCQYQRQPRRKTREALYDPGAGLRKPRKRRKKVANDTNVEPPKARRTKRQPKHAGKPGKGMKEHFTAQNVPLPRLSVRLFHVFCSLCQR